MESKKEAKKQAEEKRKKEKAEGETQKKEEKHELEKVFKQLQLEVKALAKEQKKKTDEIEKCKRDLASLEKKVAKGRGKYCYCKQPSTTWMVGCVGEEQRCPGRGWFHYHCVGLAKREIPTATEQQHVTHMAEWSCQYCQSMADLPSSA